VLIRVMAIGVGMVDVLIRSGVAGFSHKPPIDMKDGDSCSVEIGGIGTLTNPIAAEREADAGRH
jgi:2-keto-4-pentenoate hydratase/2-oxohepta-3-ene-1,7-dioic acid hydratase in catechol pathway